MLSYVVMICYAVYTVTRDPEMLIAVDHLDMDDPFLGTLCHLITKFLSWME